VKQNSLQITAEQELHLDPSVPLVRRRQQQAQAHHPTRDVWDGYNNLKPT